MRLQGSRRSWLAGCLLIGWFRATSALKPQGSEAPNLTKLPGAKLDRWPANPNTLASEIIRCARFGDAAGSTPLRVRCGQSDLDRRRFNGGVVDAFFILPPHRLTTPSHPHPP